MINNGSHPGPSLDFAEALAAFVASGKGVVVTPRGLDSALKKRSTPLPSFSFHPLEMTPTPPQSVVFLDVTIDKADHPIVGGMSARFRTADLVPSGVVLSQGVETLAFASPVRGGKSEPVLAVSNVGKGRVAALTLGHDRSAIHESAFAALFARICEWAGSGVVTLPPTSRPSRPAPGAVRALLITGGHDHEASFYGLFEGYDDLDWLPVDTSANAFKNDLREKYDVVIMYDFTRDLDDVCKRNLRDFVESGKGIVVLHHALLNYQTWAWWSEDVVGGRYRLQKEGSSPSSSVNNDQSIDATPASSHSVLSGITPFHINDEAYKNLYMSEKITPLLTTDNPTSDVNLAWIGPCKTSRVVAIQLGHGHSAFGHPSYRKLVHNAIVWSAGKTP